MQKDLDDLFKGPLEQDKGLIHSIWGTEEKGTSVVVAVSRSSIKLKNESIEEIWKRYEEYGREVEKMNEEEANIFVRNGCKFKLQKNSLFFHRNIYKSEEKDVDYRRRIIPDDLSIRRKNLHEVHTEPYMGHPGIVKKLRIAKIYFLREAYARGCSNFCTELPSVSN